MQIFEFHGSSFHFRITVSTLPRYPLSKANAKSIQGTRKIVDSSHNTLYLFTNEIPFIHNKQ